MDQRKLTERLRDSSWVKHWFDQAGVQAAERIEELEAALSEVKSALEHEPEYHDQGMGCGLEDRNITDRYEAMRHGWDQAFERIFSETIGAASDVIEAAAPSNI